MRLYLASASPRRLELLLALGIEPAVVSAGLDEQSEPGERPRDLVLRLAEAKARLGSTRLAPDAEPGVVLGADTAVVIEEQVLGKPAGPLEAEAMLRRLRDRSHDVLTGVFLIRTDDGRWTRDAGSTRVRFRNFDDSTLEAYVASGEGLDKAGAYGLQDRGGALLAEDVHGSWSNVVGLPVDRLSEWLARLDVDLERDLRRR